MKRLKAMDNLVIENNVFDPPLLTTPGMVRVGTFTDKPLLTFNQFSCINMERHLNWPRNGSAPPQFKWNLSDWTVAVAEETGELCGAIKRYNRIKDGQIMKGKPNEPKSPEEALLNAKKEIGDIVTYLDLLAQELGSDLEECTRLAYNGVSEREGMDYKI